MPFTPSGESTRESGLNAEPAESSFMKQTLEDVTEILNKVLFNFFTAARERYFFHIRPKPT